MLYISVSLGTPPPQGMVSPQYDWQDDSRSHRRETFVTFLQARTSTHRCVTATGLISGHGVMDFWGWRDLCFFFAPFLQDGPTVKESKNSQELWIAVRILFMSFGIGWTSHHFDEDRQAFFGTCKGAKTGFYLFGNGSWHGRAVREHNWAVRVFS